MSAVEALQDALASEHAALYLYGVLGARTSLSATPDLHTDLSDAYVRHRSRRDTLRRFLAEVGAEPGAAAPAYEVPGGWNRPGPITRAARGIEITSAEEMAALVARTAAVHREWAATELGWSAVRQLRFGGSAVAWPGAPELEVEGRTD